MLPGMIVMLPVMTWLPPKQASSPRAWGAVQNIPAAALALPATWDNGLASAR